MTKQSIHQHEIQVTVDIVVFTVDDQKLKVLLIRSKANMRSRVDSCSTMKPSMRRHFAS